jgi:hypothetical protein
MRIRLLSCMLIVSSLRFFASSLRNSVVKKSKRRVTQSIYAESRRERIEKYITGIIKDNQSQLYAIYANPEHVVSVVQ